MEKAEIASAMDDTVEAIRVAITSQRKYAAAAIAARDARLPFMARVMTIEARTARKVANIETRYFEQLQRMAIYASYNIT